VALTIFGAGLWLTPLFRRGRRNALDLELAELEIPLEGLPKAFDGYRILHLSDTHFDALPAIADAAQPLLAGLTVDMVALTGDVHSYPRNPVALSVGMLKRVLSGVTVRDRRLAVLGNHDPVEMIDALAGLGFETLVNQSTKLHRDGDSVHVTGVDDPHSFYAPVALTTLQEQVEIDDFKIALVHSGELADHAADAGFSLYLCGHTHAGQIALPNGKLVFTQLVRCRHTAAGLWQEGKMVGYTSSGLGVSPPTVRFNTRGGAALITLRRQESQHP
jgi:predicted MPP superfamily phosphohydrolase